MVPKTAYVEVTNFQIKLRVCRAVTYKTVYDDDDFVKNEACSQYLKTLTHHERDLNCAEPVPRVFST